ncbi:transcription initiation factor TFIID subunit 5 [Drosophila grimshawi]|nr:transcription initiation factor TFIID subunit 5 [Drosophila grimshawi]
MLSSEDERGEATYESDQHIVNYLNEYEELFHEIRKIIPKVPNRFKYEIYSLLFPTLTIVYFRMVISGKFRKGRAFVESSRRYFDHSYTARVDKLLGMQDPRDIPHKARKLVTDDKEKVRFSMFKETYYLLEIHRNFWRLPIQMMFSKHFEPFPDNKNDAPRQHTRIGSPLLEKIYWATPKTLYETNENSPIKGRRKRAKKNQASPTKSVNLPTVNRLYTPTAKRWDMERIKEEDDHRASLNRDNLPSVYLYTAHENVEIVTCAAFSSKTTMLGIGTEDSAVHVFSLTSSKLVQLKSATYLKQLDTSMSGIDESMLDATKRKMRRSLYGHRGAVYGCSFAPHDRFLLSCSQDRTVRCWCLLSWSCVVIYPGHCGAIYNVTYAPLGYYFATTSDDRTARIWVQDSKKCVSILGGHLAEVGCCQFHPNRHYLATGSADCTVRIWDIVKALQVRIFTGHKDGIRALAYSMCGRYLVSGSDDHYVIVWDTDKEQLVRCLSHHTGPINCIEFELDNKLFTVGGQDCQMTIWDFEGITQEYVDPKPKEVQANSQESDAEHTPSELSSEDFMIMAYPSNGTPFYTLRITSRNLLLGLCVRPKKDDRLIESDTNVERTEWLKHLDILMVRACYAPENREILRGLESSSDENESNEETNHCSSMSGVESVNDDADDCDVVSLQDDDVQTKDSDASQSNKKNKLGSKLVELLES